MIVIIRTDGTRIQIDRDHPPALEDLREWIGCNMVGPVELSPVFAEEREDTQVIVGEEMLQREKPVNPVASALTGKSVAGDVVLLSAGNRLE